MGVLKDPSWARIRVGVGMLKDPSWAGTRLICVASNAGFEAMKAREYDIVLCDYQMATMSGVQMTELFRAWETHNRPQGQFQTIFALTAFNDEEIIQECKAGKMQGLVCKPLSMGPVLEMVEELMSRDQQTSPRWCSARNTLSNSI